MEYYYENDNAIVYRELDSNGNLIAFKISYKDEKGTIDEYCLEDSCHLHIECVTKANNAVKTVVSENKLITLTTENLLHIFNQTLIDIKA